MTTQDTDDLMPMSSRLTRELRQFYRRNRGKCSQCSRPFQPDDLEHLGYAADGVLLYVGNCCKSKLVETAVRYGYSHPGFETPPFETIIWRYMDFPKLLHLIASRKLYFRRLDLLADAWEGAIGLSSKKEEWDDFYKQFFSRIVKNSPPGYDAPSEEEAARQAARLFEEWREHGGTHRRTTFVNCWHGNSPESEAMWRLYSSYLEHAVAIQSTVRRLNAALDDDPDVDIGRVEYVDYEDGFISKYTFFHKRRSFSHEREIRAVIRCHDNQDLSGLLHPVDVETLIEKVHLSPEAPDWFSFVAQETLGRFGMQFPVLRSSLLKDTPFF